MNVKNKLRNTLVKKLQQLSLDKLTEVSNALDKIENHLKSKEKTLSLAGAWKELDDAFFTEMTEKLHHDRANDRKID